MCACLVGTLSGPSVPAPTAATHSLFGDPADCSQAQGLYSVEMEADQVLENGFEDGEDAILEDREGDVYAQLAKKDQDLVLAAQFGKALLEKNEILNKRSDQLTEDIEELTQERHSLRLRLESKESEYESTVRELQSDITQLKQELEKQGEEARESYRAKSTQVNELTQQNERLADQLKKSAQKEEQLEQQVKNFKQSVLQRRSSIQEHVHQLVVLREEITMLTERRDDLECLLRSMTEERDSLACNLEEAQGRVLMLEKQNREQQQQLRTHERELSQLQDQNADLHDKLETLSTQTQSSALETTQHSLYSELEMSLNNTGDSPKSEDSNESYKLGQACRPTMLFPAAIMGFSHIFTDDDDGDDVECDDMGVIMDSPQAKPMDCACANSNMTELKQEVSEVHRHLQRMVCELQGRDWKPGLPTGDQAADQDGIASAWKSGSLLDILTDLKALMQEMVHKPLEMQDGRSITPTSPLVDLDTVHTMETQVRSLQSELATHRAEVEKLKANLEFKDQQLEKKTEELGELSNKMSLQHQELIHVQLERDRLQDQSAGITRDEIVEQTRQERDQAMEKTHNLEVELSTARLDMMNLEKQLMNAIQQKVALSQQLEQWEVDMQELLGAQMAKQINEQKRLDVENTKKKNKAASGKRKISLFSRR